jgi:hypothetical protein
MVADFAVSITYCTSTYKQIQVSLFASYRSIFISVKFKTLAIVLKLGPHRYRSMAFLSREFNYLRFLLRLKRSFVGMPFSKVWKKLYVGYLADKPGVSWLKLTVAESPVISSLEHVRLPVCPRERCVQVSCSKILKG